MQLGENRYVVLPKDFEKGYIITRTILRRILRNMTSTSNPTQYPFILNLRSVDSCYN